MAVHLKKVIDEAHLIPRARGNGKLRREVWVGPNGQVARYNLAYVNLAVFQRDNGRVVGYDSQHGAHHRHFFGEISEIEFTSFEDIEAQFERDWVNVAPGRRR
jgi:hypothetical protein